MHVPKCAGTSITESLSAALPAGAIAPRRFDTFIFCGFSGFDRLYEPNRSEIAVEDSELLDLARYPVVAGHFSLPTLRRLAPAASIATVLREPRARLVSAFMFVRLSAVIHDWQPYGSEVLAEPARSFEAFLSDPRIAPLNDNLICRLVLHGEAGLLDTEFIAPGDAAGFAELALDRLDRLGYVGILEQDDIWGGCSSFFGVPLERMRSNVSGEAPAPEGALPIPPFDMRSVLDLIERRSMADRLIYEGLLARRCGSAGEARRIADAALAAELVHFGDVTGSAATKLTELGAYGLPG
jgi:hypothetical protein